MVVWEGFPGCAVGAVVFAHRAPRPLAQIGTPAFPMFFAAGVFFKALTLTQPVLSEAVQQQLGVGQYLLILLQTMTALYHANGGRPFTTAELSQRTPLEDAMTLYDLRVVSLGIAARIANVSISEFVDALGRAGIPVFQYGADEVLAEVAELEAR